MLSMFGMEGKVALVTGASRGLGEFFARTLAEAGADLVVTSRHPERLDGLCAEIRGMGRRVLPVALDVLDPAQSEAMAERAEAEFGRIDVLINNAGMNIRKPVIDVTPDDWDQVVGTNLRGGFFCAQAVAKRMLPRGYGRIVNIGSCTCVFGMEGIVPYTASRGGVLQMTRGMAAEWGRNGVTVNCLAPGWFRTAQTEALYSNPEWLQYICDRIPVGRPGAVEDLAGALLFLASDASRYVTGQILLVDGGFTTGSTRAIVPRKE